MQIIVPMDGEKFKTVCGAGVELIGKLSELLAEHGLDQTDALAVLSVACSGVALIAQVAPGSFTDGIEAATRFWTVDGSSMTFDPGKPDHVAPVGPRSN